MRSTQAIISIGCSQRFGRPPHRLSLVTAPVLVVLLVLEPLLMRVAIRIAIGIYERANARSVPMPCSSARLLNRCASFSWYISGRLGPATKQSNRSV
jgi:hypothetical protein